MTNQSNRSTSCQMSAGRPGSWRAVARIFLLPLLAIVGSTGCPPQPRPATPPAGVDPPLAQAVDLLLYDLNRQLGPAPDGTRMTVFDPLLDGKTGQQTGASVVVQKQIVHALGPAVRS